MLKDLILNETLFILGFTQEKIHYHTTARSSHSEVFCNIDLLKNFEKFTGKHLCRCLFQNFSENK